MKDFISDAYYHQKFIAYSPSSQPLINTLIKPLDKGLFVINNKASILTFLNECGKLRYWTTNRMQ